MEKFFIREYNSKDREKGYNLTDGGEGISGYKHTKESKEKMSLAVRNFYKTHVVVFSEEHRKNMGLARKGNKHYGFIPVDMEALRSDILSFKLSPSDIQRKYNITRSVFIDRRRDLFLDPEEYKYVVDKSNDLFGGNNRKNSPYREPRLSMLKDEFEFNGKTMRDLMGDYGIGRRKLKKIFLQKFFTEEKFNEIVKRNTNKKIKKDGKTIKTNIPCIKHFFIRSEKKNYPINKNRLFQIVILYIPEKENIQFLIWHTQETRLQEFLLMGLKLKNQK